MKKVLTGFTLLELIMAVFLFAIIAGAVAAFSAYYFKNYAFSFEENQSIGLAQTGMTTMIRDIRRIRMGEDGSWPIIDAQDNSFSFYSDVTSDGRTDKIRYFLNGTTLQKGVIEPTAVPVTYPAGNEKFLNIATYVDTSQGPIFQYYNGSWPSDTIHNPLILADRQLNTRYIKVYLRININQNYSAAPFELSSGVTIRSMKDNL
jgi:prepilin-type N-terminal cleavage/methylation domain-containing protein